MNVHTPELVAMREREAEAGLPAEQRVVMRLALAAV
jgi:hypothetical protein